LIRRSIAAIWGVGRFGGGVAVAAWLAEQGHAIRLVDRCTEGELAEPLEELRQRGVDATLWPEQADSLTGADLVVVNPAIRPNHPLLDAVDELGIRRTQELNLFLETYPGHVIAVTGTNGKSTTATMLAAALRAGHGASGVLLGGNIGHSLLEDRSQWRRDQWAVVEVSSFQADRLSNQRGFFDHVVLTPITTDHLDWHGTIDAYRSAKLRLVDAVVDGGQVVGWPQCQVYRECVLPRLRPLAQPAIERGCFDSLQLLGGFNRQNAGLALTAAELAGVDTWSAIDAIKGVEGLPHRLCELGHHGGIAFIDNGASTVAETSLTALRELDGRGPVRWVCGGRAKTADIDAYGNELAQLAASVHPFGEVADNLSSMLQKQGKATRAHSTLGEALDAAWQSAGPGDIVLFSPGFVSYDAYPNYAARAGEAVAWWRRRRDGIA
jgi:UDP-N-acetylmuramoylalanine--D-glutamate ligase